VHYPNTACSGKTMNGSFCKANREDFDRYSFSFYSSKWTHSSCAKINIATRRIILAVVCYFALFVRQRKFHIYDEIS
jgi:hypothetical protein